MAIKILQLNLGLAATNAYIIGDTEINEAILIDPVDDAQRLLAAAKNEGWNIRLILATHAHFDHVLASKEIKELTGAPFYIHEDCVPWLEQLPTQGRLFGLSSFPEAAKPNQLLTSGSEEIDLGGIKLKTLYTPGHAPGHLSFYLPSEHIVFSGDTLFAGSIGRTDLPGGDYNVLMDSIFSKLIPLGDETIVLAGHMQATTIGQERLTNPFLLDYMEKQ
ncbi:MAG: MBL fold metallo-hydrolase [Anaerolineaceae bacterium]|nr:MBL fold metallo-hydrolase [Anaerolineaceae bacterium]